MTGWFRYPTPARAAQALGIFLAANSGASRPTDASLNVYLAWVDSMDGRGPAPSLAPAAPPAAPRPKKPALPSGGVEVVEVEEVVEVIDDPPPPPPPPPQPPRRARREDEREEPPAAKKVRKAGSDEEDEEEESDGIMGMTRKESTILIVGLVSVIGLAVVGLLVWLVLKLVR